MINIEEYESITREIVKSLVKLASEREEGLIYMEDIDAALQEHYNVYETLSKEVKSALCKKMMDAIVAANAVRNLT